MDTAIIEVEIKKIEDAKEDANTVIDEALDVIKKELAGEEGASGAEGGEEGGEEE